MKKVAVITGASSGIGAAISQKIARRGYYVVMASRNIEKMKSIAIKIEKEGGKSLIVPVDITKAEDINKLYLESSSIGNVEILINNSGIGIFSKVENTSIEDWDKQMDVNLKGSFLTSRKFIPNMKKNKLGCIVFINSVAGKKGYAFSSAYVASKYGLRGLADSLREELREHNIKVVSIHPGAVDTPFWDSVDADFPRKEMLKPEEISDVIVHSITMPGNLVSEEIVLRRTKGDF